MLYIIQAETKSHRLGETGTHSPGGNKEVMRGSKGAEVAGGCTKLRTEDSYYCLSKYDAV
jgi:hypothetical protein